ncbi:hypothetical protein M0R45_034977 [Rubus argutus]|uniref:TIR domain-containing protein n=1 Tax=Rubus argutus TaxID=59490 RepID=A0AAW1VRT7_RUBAR
MAGEASSSNSSLSRCSHDVFLSFRGEDTRKTFVDHLYKSLVNAGIRTFRDDDEIERGEDIKPELQKAIQQSWSSVIVFSKDYASSRWCLDELVMILQRKRRISSSSSDRHVVLPVFYDINPSHVRNQTGSVAVAFARHQKTQLPNKVNEWRAALAEVADLGGMVLQNQADGYESKFIGKIVKVIGDKLRRNKPFSVAPNLIGIHSRVKRINSWLQDGSSDVGILVIYGMPGIGKTTIAKHVYNSNFRRFERSSFLENIRGISEQHNGIIQIQTQLLFNILNGRKVQIHNVSEGVSMLEDAVSSKRVLLFLDDLDHMDQLNALLSRRDRFYPGSKIVITTRNARLSKSRQVTRVHTVESLYYNESLELFSWHAFGQDHPDEGYMEHSKLVAHQSGGLPLAIQILGSSLMGERIGVWESALKKLQSIPNSEIMGKLRICYDSLQDDHDQNLFLDIACFFVGKDKDYIVRILDGCDFYTIIGVQNLIDRCLVTVDEFNKVHMHDMIRDMGREIVRLESKELGRRSRIWHHKDSFKILGEKSGTESIEGLVLDMHMHHGDTLINSNEIVLETKAFSRTHKLRLLQLDHVQLHGCYEEFPPRLRWLCWLAFPLDSIPIDFPLENLVILEMQYSSLKQMWKGTKCLPSLKVLDLSHSHGLTKTIDFSLCHQLEKLVLIDCVSLIEVYDSIGDLKRLVYLNMKDCINIRMLPKSIFMLKLLETLIISGCSNLDESSMKSMRSMESLKILEADRISSQSLSTSMEGGGYRFGILGLFRSGNKVPGLFSLRSRESTISFTVPLHPNRRIGGLNVLFVYANSCNGSAMIGDSDVCYSTDFPIVVKVRNKSKGLKWIYPPPHYGVPGEGEDMMWLTHWKFRNQLEGGDQVGSSGCFGICTTLASDTEEEESEEGRQEEEEEEEGRITVAAMIARIDKMILFNMSTESADRVYKYDDDGGDDDVVDIKRDDDRPDGDNVEHAANQSVFTSPKKNSEKRKRSSFTDACAESSKKRNEMFEQRFIGSESLPGNDAAQSVAKDVSDEECLMQCVEILNKMEEIDDDSYSKALKLFHDVPTWRKIFVVMPDQRRKNFILKL